MISTATRSVSARSAELGLGRPGRERERPAGSQQRSKAQGDTLLTLFEEVDGEPRFLAGDDDSGEERNARIEVKLFQGRRHIVRFRLFFAAASGLTTVMYW